MYLYIKGVYLLKINLNGIPKVFPPSLITKVTNFVKISLFIGYPFLFFYFN